MAHNFQNAWIQPKVLGRAAAGNHERVVIIGLNLVEGRIQSEIVTSLLAISLVALKIVDGGPHRIAGPLIGTDGMDAVPDHEERPERSGLRWLRKPIQTRQFFLPMTMGNFRNSFRPYWPGGATTSLLQARYKRRFKKPANSTA